MLKYFIMVAVVCFSLVSLANKDHAPGPCQQIKEACKSAGFVKGEWKKGTGLMRDCINPIMQGQTSVPGATKPLPTVDSNLVAQCKAKHPEFGHGQIGGAPKK